ncbi:hypothetical protein ACUXKL_001846 [Kocuria marina]
MPDTTCPCAGAAQKILYMACDLWRSRGALDDMRVVLTAPEDTIFGVPVGATYYNGRSTTAGSSCARAPWCRPWTRDRPRSNPTVPRRKSRATSCTPRPRTSPRTGWWTAAFPPRERGFVGRGSREAAPSPVRERLGTRGHRSHPGLQFRWCAAEADTRCSTRGRNAGPRSSSTAGAFPGSIGTASCGVSDASSYPARSDVARPRTDPEVESHAEDYAPRVVPGHVGPAGGGRHRAHAAGRSTRSARSTVGCRTASA